MQLDKKNKILIVDDQLSSRNSLKNLVFSLMSEMNLNFEVIEGSDGNDLITILTEDYSENAIKLVFTDEDMENINGSTAIEAMRLLETKYNYISKTIISVTSSMNWEMIIKSGADLVLAKPLRKADLKDIIRKTLLRL